MIVRNLFDCSACGTNNCVIIDDNWFWESAICQSCDKVIVLPRDTSERNRERIVSGYIREMLRYETPELYCVVISKMYAPDNWDKWEKKIGRKQP